MLQSIKNIIPRAVRNRLRPFYRRLCQMVVDSRIWPKPSEWNERKRILRSNDSNDEFYKFACEEFGIIQNEKEILPFLEFVKKHKPRIAGEIGMKEGGNSFLFMQALKSLELIISMDLQLKNTGKLRYMARENQKLICIEGDSHVTETVEKVSNLLGKKKFDFLFIDGDHSYDGVKQDFLYYSPMVKEGGLIAFHDIVPDHLTRYGKAEPCSTCYAGGVHQLWSELKPHFTNYEFVDDRQQSGFGIGVIIKQEKYI